MFESLIPAIGSSVVGGLFGMEGASKQNQRNFELMLHQNSFSAGEAHKLRDWQEQMMEEQYGMNKHLADRQMDFQNYMSNTAFQRSVKDLSEAGLNPMLAYMKGGASTPSGSGGSVGLPSGSSPSTVSPPRMENVLQAGANSAFRASELSATVANMYALNDKIKAETALTYAQIPKAEADTRTSNATAYNIHMSTERIITGEIPKLRHEIQSISADLLNKSAEHVRIQVDTELKRVQQLLEAGRISNVEASTAVQRVEAVLKQAEVPEAMAFSEKFKTEWGKDVSPYLKEALDLLRMLTLRRDRSR